MVVTSADHVAQSTDDARMQLPGLQGGSGHDSYSHNSQTQNYVFHEYGKPHLYQALHYVLSTFLSSSTCSSSSGQVPQGTQLLRIADLGCSHGPNTLEHARFIVQTLLQQGAFKQSNLIIPHTHTNATMMSPSQLHVANNDHSHIELHYLFSDLPGNDFNALFRSLQPIGPQLQNFVDLPPSHMSIFGAGVPGSFYGRLFPRESLHLAVCNFSLHWLSQVPLPVVDRNSEAWNGGHVWIHAKMPKVCEAYAHQFQIDAKAFLANRVQELVRGGILFIFAMSRSELHPTGLFLDIKDGNDFWMGDFDSCWQDMVDEGVVSEEERDMFNVPQYNFHRRELETALQGLEDDVEVVEMDLLKKCNIIPIGMSQHLVSNKEAFGKVWTNLIASLVKPLVQAHLGKERAEELFKRLQHKAIKRATSFTPPITPPTLDVIVATIRRRL